MTSSMITDYTPFLSARALNRKPSPIRELMKIMSPDMISLGGGLPNPATFPFKNISFELKTGESLSITGTDLQVALQYSQSYGIESFTKWLKEFQQNTHNLVDPTTPGRQWTVEVTNGSQEGLTEAIDTLLGEGDSVIVESPTYSGTLSIFNPIGVTLAGVPVDAHGIVPEQLEDLLANWDTRYAGKPKPKVLYTIPTGQNPSGCTMTVERKRSVYAICSNKVLSSGLRIGFVTGPAALVEKTQIMHQATSLHASGVSQMIAYTLLKAWGKEGFNKHVAYIQEFYRAKRDTFCECLDRYLGDMIEYNKPVAGMFVWIKVKGVNDTFSLISTKAIEKKVILTPGIAFSPDTSVPSTYVRASFSTATTEQMDEACKRFGELLKENVHSSAVSK
ncbi:hypothetical protein SAMD00019534_098950 [Acytostelium subglobosum LB1]|uniref:hypothetical protein n=1 Tax=Acytostelium subglobosum LB1 TaxID=1410327 RepID=UPI000644D9FF|nr:hypothetical protein SAMD00019534_098950 [Acytostelium subglobosum LB1]GAM26720.1 hypothetical protein SAMD00019534_098950 [Acytostelium subglobosum LB1]|eukprot:XP_012750381.1 hypothetical protein SAMD00019534_098950 [Acytostelium subglobosum LB1]